jgi:hypothetical protein
LEFLPAYPDVLQCVVDLARPLLNEDSVSRLLCTADALPLGVALSVQTQIPLVYSRGSASPPVHDLVGAYDSGHPAVLLTNVLSDEKPITILAAHAKRAGLEAHRLIAIIDLGTTVPPHGLETQAILKLPEIVRKLASSGKLAVGQAEAAEYWLAQRQTSNQVNSRPRDSTAP